ncbi:hypothetical protein PVAG01_10423 [Phlyctema vagabunda]|uniref:Uncharacterized protein n=1 Tax=Phlyctema vagabunda TaxID=108571 RepID=A0ABR4P619_9HELO
METNDGEECLMRYKKWLETSLENQHGPEDVEFGYELACIYNETGVAYAMNEMTGKILYALGNVYVSQRMFGKGSVFHTRCFNQHRATLGNDHHRVGDICVRLADHNLRMKNFPEAKNHIKQALKISSSRSYDKQELARATFKQGQTDVQGYGRCGCCNRELPASFQPPSISLVKGSATHK